MVTHYQGSRGPVEIAAMTYPHLRNAHDKLVREQAWDRHEEIAAMRERLAVLDAERQAEEEARG